MKRGKANDNEKWTQTYRHETAKGFAQHRKKGEKGRTRDNYHSRSMKVTREATVAVEGGVQPGIIVGRHAILKRGTRGDFVNARRYLTIYRSLINYLHNRPSPRWLPRFLSIHRVNTSWYLIGGDAVGHVSVCITAVPILSSRCIINY